MQAFAGALARSQAGVRCPCTSEKLEPRKMESDHPAQDSTGGKQPVEGLFEQEEFPKHCPKTEVSLHYLANATQS